MAKPRCLSVRQPFAWMLTHPSKDDPDVPIKDVENRTWSREYRGTVVIHSGKALTMPQRRLIGDHIDDGNVPEEAKIFLGGYIGTADLVDIVKDSESPWAQRDLQHWVFRNPRSLPYISIKGRLQLYELDWPWVEGAKCEDWEGNEYTLPFDIPRDAELKELDRLLKEVPHVG